MVSVVLLAAAAACIPVRWFSTDVKSLDLLAGTPVNCLVLEQEQAPASFVKEAESRGLRVFIEGREVAFQTRAGARAANGVVAVGEAVWPRVRVDDDAVAGPTAAPWIDTNVGYLRYLRTQTTGEIWLGNRPPAGTMLTGRRYQVAVADAALVGARWVVALEPALSQRLLSGEAAARRDWAELVEELRFLASLPDVARLEVSSDLGVSVSRETGAFVSGGVLDMMGSQHIPFRIVNGPDGMRAFFPFADDSVVKFPKGSLGAVRMRTDDVAELEHVYRRVQVAVGRTNYGLRVFNGAAMLSMPYRLPGGGVMVLLANYTDHSAEDITLHVLGRWTKATLRTPGSAEVQCVTYPVEGATAVEVKSLPVMGAVFLE